MTGVGESEFAARLSARYDEFEAEKQGILADYDFNRAHIAAVERDWDAASQPGAGSFWAHQQGVPTEEQLRVRRDELLDQAKDRLERDLRLLERERGIADPAPDVAEGEAVDLADELLGGLPYVRADYETAGKLHKKNKMTVAGVEKRGLSRKRAYRIYRQFRAGAVVYDDAGLHPGPGYRWDPVELDHDPPMYKLIRR